MTPFYFLPFLAISCHFVPFCVISCHFFIKPWLLSISETLSPLDANLPYADDFHPTNDLDGARGNSRSANAAASTNHRNDLQGNDFLRSNEVNANNSEAPSEIPPYTSAEYVFYFNAYPRISTTIFYLIC